jgi:hypothetical protein
MKSDSTYELIHSPTPTDLSREVLHRVELGWWPLGTPFVHGERYIQAMVHEPSPGNAGDEPADDR